MKYTLDRLNRILPPPEILFFVAEAVLFILNVVLLSGHFAKKLKQELGKVQGITEKIAENDLEFEADASDIREMDEVLFSLSKMKTALKTSLTRQWSLEEQKREQCRASGRGRSVVRGQSVYAIYFRECEQYGTISGTHTAGVKWAGIHAG